MKEFNFINWLLENMNWVFSGIGISIICILYSFFKYVFFRKNSKNNYLNIANGSSVIFKGTLKGSISTGNKTT